MLTSKEMTAIAVKALDDKMAKEIKVLAVRELTVLTEYFVICTAGSTAQVKTLSDELSRVLEEKGEETRRVEGRRDGGWILVDFGCLVVHIFLDEQRKFYNLERLWGDAPEIGQEELLKLAEEISDRD